MRLRRVPLSMSLSIAGLAGLAGGCELVAGIQDLALTGSELDAASAGASGDSSYGGSPGDATLTDAQGGQGGGGNADATDAGDATRAVSADGSAVPGDAVARADAAEGAPEAAAPDDAGAGPLVGPDGGPIALELIDDMEDTNPSPGWLDGPFVTGTWFTFDDGSDGGVLTPAPGASAAPIIALLEATHVTFGAVVSAHAAHVTANSAFAVYGDGMGFNVHVANGVPAAFDATAYQGFVFWARALGNSAAPGTRFNVMDVGTTPPGSGGVCDGGGCNGFFGFDFGKSQWPALTSTWQMYVVYFSELTRPVWATSDPGFAFDPTQMIGCQFQLAESTPGDLWVDDIYFIRK